MPFNVQCKRCFHLYNDWCKPKHDSPDPDIVRDCLHFKEKTNGDRLRAMSDEELALAIRMTANCDLCPIKNCKARHYSSLDNCERHWLAWLQSPADGGNAE